MPLGARELLLVVRARDVASRVLREVGTNIAGLGTQGRITGQQMIGLGSALTGVGTVLAGVGVASLAFFNSATDAAIEYNRQAALTRTQVDDVSVSVSQLGDIGKRVARAIPAPFEEMQDALFDIFSSMDVNVGEAELLLASFSRAAVAGQTDVRTAARSTISIMNAYQLPVSQVNRVLDLQFELVRKGVGTYEEFNTSLGRAIPAAVAAGQEFETLAGMMAFLTRNGLSTEMAATSAARAFELFADPKRFKKLEKLGITVRDSSGQFLQLNDIVTQLATNQAWATMAEPERKELFQDIFGQGTIQARRFFDLAIPNYAQLNGLTADMVGASGALGVAYKTMFEEPASQAQLLANQYEILKVEIGEELIPIKLKLMETIMKVIDWWNNLSESTRDLIVKITLFASVAAVVVGVVLVMTGAFMMLVGTAMLLGVSLGVVLAAVAAITLAIMGVGAIIVGLATGDMRILIAGFGLLSAGLLLLLGPLGLVIAGVVALAIAIVKNWGKIKDIASSVWQTIQDFWDWVTANAVKVWQAVWKAITDAWGKVQKAGAQLWSWFQTAWAWLDEHFGEGFAKIWSTIWEEVGAVFEEVAETFAHAFEKTKLGVEVLWAVVQPLLSALITFITMVVVPALGIWVHTWAMIFNVIRTIVTTALTVIFAAIQIWIGTVIAAWNAFGGTILGLVKTVWNFIAAIIVFIIRLVSNTLQLFMNIIQGDWKEAWNNIKNIFKAAWDLIWAALQAVWGLIRAFFIQMPGAIVRFIGSVGRLLWNKGRDILNGLWTGLKGIWGSVSAWLTGLPGKVKAFFAGAAQWLYQAGRKVLQGLWDGLKSIWNDIKNWLGGLPGAILDLKGPPEKDAELLVKNGMLIMQGLGKGLRSGWRDVTMFLGKTSKELDTYYTSVGAPGGPGLFGPQGGPTSGEQAGPRIGINVENLHVREESVVSDLDWWYRTIGTGV